MISFPNIQILIGYFEWFNHKTEDNTFKCIHCLTKMSHLYFDKFPIEFSGISRCSILKGWDVFFHKYIYLFSVLIFQKKIWLNFNRIIKIITTFSRTKLKSFPDVTQIVWEKSWIQFQILFWKWGYQSRIIVFLPKNFGNVWIKLKWVEDVWNVLGFSKKELSEL